MAYNSNALQKLATKLLCAKTNFEKLREIGNRNNYPVKVQKLKQRLTEEYKLWSTRGPSARLSDIERDIKYLTSLLNKTTYNLKEMNGIDELVKKHPIDQL